MFRVESSMFYGKFGKLGKTVTIVLAYHIFRLKLSFILSVTNDLGSVVTDMGVNRA